MSDVKLRFNIDAAQIASEMTSFTVELEQDLNKAVGNLAAITDAKVKEMAQKELKSTREIYLDALGFEEVAPNVWVISVDESAMFIEEGLPENFDMKPGLLKDASTAKNGNKYKVIPFNYGKAPSSNTPQTQQLVSFLRQQLKKENIPFKKIEKNADGSPRLGKLHEKDFGNPGGQPGGPGKGNTPVFKGLTVIQSQGRGGQVRRDILTFRTVSSGPKSSGKWVHPGLEAKKFLDRAFDFCVQVWSDQILPEVLKKYGK